MEPLQLIRQPRDLELLLRAQVFDLRPLLQLLVPIALHVVKLLPHLADEVHLLVDHVIGLALIAASIILHRLQLRTEVVVFHLKLIILFLERGEFLLLYNSTSDRSDCALLVAEEILYQIVGVVHHPGGPELRHLDG